MTNNKLFSFLALASLLLFFCAQAWAETDCGREAIAFYLDKGFTPEQISRMCQASVDSSDTGDPTSGQFTSVVSGTPVDVNLDDEAIFFNKTILSDTLTVTPETLTYVREECIKYGEEDVNTTFRPKVCGVLKTTINRVGLVVLRAVKGLSIFRDAELLVKGEIRREVMNLDALDSDDRNAFSKVLDPAPQTFDIQVRDGADPTEIAARLPR